MDSLKGKPRAQNRPELQYVFGQWNNDQYRDYIRRYWGYSSFIDAQIGKVFKTLKETDQWDNTIIIFTTDHGDMIAAHGMIYKLGSNGYEELFHVPTILRIPGAETTGVKIPQLVSSVDLLPTILEAMNLKAPAQLDGKSLIPILNHSSDAHRESLFSEVHGAGRIIICRDKQYKYVYHWLSNDVDELYDLSSDPGEMHNLYQDPEYQEVAKQMREKIIQWAQETGHRYSELIKQKHFRVS
jgi:arylsulfatase A-like enzyme